MIETFDFVTSLLMCGVITFGIGCWVGSHLIVETDCEAQDEELAKLEREVELMRLKVKAQDLQKQLNM